MFKILSLLIKKRQSLIVIIFFCSIVSAVSVYAPLLVLPNVFLSIASKEKLILWIGIFFVLQVVFVPVYQFFHLLLVHNATRFNNEITASLYDKAMKVPYESLSSFNIRSQVLHATGILKYDFDYNDAVLDFSECVEKLFYVLSSIYVSMSLFQAAHIFILLVPFVIGMPILYFYHRFYSSKITSMINYHAQLEREFAYYRDDIIYNYDMYPTFHIFNMFKFLNTKIFRNSSKTVNYFMKSRKLNNFNSFILACVMCLSSFASYYVIMQNVTNKIILPSDILTNVQSLIFLYSSVFLIYNKLQTLKRNVIYMDTIEDILHLEEEKIDGKTMTDDEVCFEFKDVSFAYPNSDKNALSHINLKLSSNSMNALVGKNGSGKTTLVLLLTRLLKPSSGVITLNGVDIQDIDLNQYRKMLSCIFQDSSIFPLSLRENVLLRDESSDEKKLAIDIRLKEKFNGDALRLENIAETNLSGGEKQKVLIERALHRETKALILDEPNSALDVESEEDFYAQVRSTSKSSLLLFVTHRMRSCKDCDVITVLDGGKVVGIGKHDELLATCTEYRTLWDAQLKMYDVGT